MEVRRLTGAGQSPGAGNGPGAGMKPLGAGGRRSRTITFSYHRRPIRLAVHSIGGKLDYLGRQIERDGTFWEIDNLQQTLRFLENGDVVFDCGANIGNHSVFWSIHGCKVYAFEPDPENFKLLLRNMEMNNCKGSNFQLLLGDGSDITYRVRKNPMNPGNNVYVPHDDGQTASRLDDICFLPVRLVKIDVEGAEMQVLRGMDRILKTFHPIVFAEYHCPVVTREQILRYLNQFGYRNNRDIFLIRDYVTDSQARALRQKAMRS
jgi:FkbM family methyltransferase